MKISELRELLLYYQENYGDADVAIWDREDGGYDRNIIDVKYTADCRKESEGKDSNFLIRLVPGLPDELSRIELREQMNTMVEKLSDVAPR